MKRWVVQVKAVMVFLCTCEGIEFLDNKEYQFFLLNWLLFYISLGFTTEFKFESV